MWCEICISFFAHSFFPSFFLSFLRCVSVLAFCFRFSVLDHSADNTLWSMTSKEEIQKLCTLSDALWITSDVNEASFLFEKERECKCSKYEMAPSPFHKTVTCGMNLIRSSMCCPLNLNTNIRIKLTLNTQIPKLYPNSDNCLNILHTSALFAEVRLCCQTSIITNYSSLTDGNSEKRQGDQD